MSSSLVIMKTHIYIDWANLHQWSKSWWWLDYLRFKQRLLDKYKAENIYIFIGYIKGKEDLYSQLSEYGYKLVFKETLEVNGKIKGNCDAELVLKAISNYYEEQTERSIFVTGDGDFSCAIDFFQEKNCEVILLAPNRKYCSYLLKKKNIPIVFIEDTKSKFKKNSQ